ncbi:MAG: hypothetical protein AAB355_00845 [Patescibacteria group bacterium]
MVSFDFFLISLSGVVKAAYEWSWLVAPFILGFIAWKVWVFYVNADFLAKMEFAVIEIKLPREIRRSPLAMELVLNAMHQTGGTATWVDRYWNGKVRVFFSLEIASIDGRVHFFIRTPVGFKNAIESYIYAQYPESEISEIPDYAEKIPYTKNGQYVLWGTEYKFTKPDPYPVKTYVDYGMDKSAKEEERIDPITPTIELMGSMQKGEQMWLQIIIRATTQEWKDLGKKEIEKIKSEKFNKEKDEKFNENMLTKAEKETITAIERSIDKIGFDAGIRAIYIAEKDAFRGTNIPAVINILKQYNSNNLNGFRLARPTGVEYPWQDFKGIRAGAKKMKMFDLYLKRSFFYPPDSRTPIILCSEELATMYHFPGGVSETPSFGRIESKKSEPPVNLPI